MLSDKSKASVIMLVIFLFGIYCFVFGQSGILERNELLKQKKIIDEEILLVERENQRLLALYDEYATGKAYASTAESLGYILPDQKVIVFTPQSTKLNEENEIFPKISSQQMPITKHLRTLWVLLSVLIVVLYSVHFRPAKKDERGK